MKQITIFFLVSILIIISLIVFLLLPKTKKVIISQKNQINPFCRKYKLSLYLDKNTEYKNLQKFCLQRGIDFFIKKKPLDFNFTKLIEDSDEYTKLYQIGELKIKIVENLFCLSETTNSVNHSN